MSSNRAAIDAMKIRVRQLIVNDLKSVCKDELLAVSGPKVVLQSRILERIDKMVATNNITGLNHMRNALSSVGRGNQLPPLSSSSQSGVRSFSSGSDTGYTNGTGSMSRNHTSTGIQFHPSPFFETLESLARPVDLPPYPSHRNQVSITFTLSPQNIERMRSDSSLRILLYCAAKPDLLSSSTSPQDIAFPSQLEVKVNEQEVRGNFKGLKNKPGSTRPADVTGFVTKQPTFTNRVLVTYALTQKGFTMVAMLVKKRSVDELVSRIQQGKIISRDKVLNEMQMRAEDPDVVVGSSIMSLKDPVSYVRIAVPCRSDICSHHQCFDAASFLQLQEQAPTWTCPICNKVVSFDGLVVDQYFEDILRRTNNSTYQVTVEPNGQWSASAAERSSGQNGISNNNNNSGDESSDDDVVEVVKPIKRESFGANMTPVTPYSMAAPTPPRASPMVSTSIGPSRPSQGQKRKSEVIDLTLSDDDEPPPKRPAYSTPNSLPDQGSRPGRTNGYSSYPSQLPPAFVNGRANEPLRIQLGNYGGSSRDGSGSSSSSTTNNNNNNNTSGNSTYTSHNHSTSSSTPNIGTGGANQPQYTNPYDFSASRGGVGDDIVFGRTNTPSFNSHSHPQSSHRPSPLSGSALAPINLTESPPQRTPSAPFPATTASSSSFGGPSIDHNLLPPPPTLPHFSDFDEFRSPPPIPPSARDTQRANASAGFSEERRSEQRAILRGLANPFGREW